MLTRFRRGTRHLPFSRLCLALAVAAACALASASAASAAPTLTVDDVSIAEPTGTNVLATFTVRLSEPTLTAVSVDTNTVAGSASPFDFQMRPTTTVTFSPGQTAKTVNVWIYGDSLDELAESFNFTLTNPTGAPISDATGVGTIVDDDAPPTISVADISIDEPDSVPETVTFSVKLSAESGRTITVDTSTLADTASGTDFAERPPTTLTFTPGGTTRALNVSVKPDALDEVDEKFKLALANATGGATIADPEGLATIVDDDAPPTLSISDPFVDEPDTVNELVTFNLSLSAPSGRTITVDTNTAAGTASTADFNPRSPTTVSFAPGATTRSISVWLRPDALDEFREFFDLTLSNLQGGPALTDTLGRAQITDDDLPPTVSIGDVTTSEPSSGQTLAQAKVTLSAPSGKPVSVRHDTSDGGALSGSDYTARLNHTITFDPGVVSLDANVWVLADPFREGAEQFANLLSNPVNATVADGSGSVTIPANCRDLESNTQDGAVDLGSIAGDLGDPFVTSAAGASICPVAGEEDWYKVTLREDDLPGDSFVSAAVSLDMAEGTPNGDLELFVYDDLGFYDSSEQTGTTDELVYYCRNRDANPSACDPDTAADDTQTIWIAVIGYPNPGPAANDYTLSVTGNQ